MKYFLLSHLISSDYRPLSIIKSFILWNQIQIANINLSSKFLNISVQLPSEYISNKAPQNSNPAKSQVNLKTTSSNVPKNSTIQIVIYPPNPLHPKLQICMFKILKIYNPTSHSSATATQLFIQFCISPLLFTNKTENSKLSEIPYFLLFTNLIYWEKTDFPYFKELRKIEIYRFWFWRSL